MIRPRVMEAAMEAVGAAVDRLLPDVVWLIRAGFVTRYEREGENAAPPGTVIHILGVKDLDRALELAALILTGGGERTAVLVRLREQMFAYAERTGRAVTVEEAAARELIAEDLDRIIREDAPLLRTAAPADLESEELARSGAEVAKAALAKLNDKCRRVVELCFVGGLGELEAARELGIGRAAVRARERQVRHHVKHALRVELHLAAGNAAVDALICGTGTAILPPPITMRRVRRKILTRTHLEAPAPFRVRARWAMGAAALAMVVLALWIAS